MGVMDKLKKILFDEEDVEIPVNSDELPERELRIVADKLEKKVASRSSKREVEPARGFKDYHLDDDEDEDTIVELKVPKEEEEHEHPQTQEKRIKFPIDDFDDDDDDEYVPTRSARDEESKSTYARRETPVSETSRTESSRIPKYISDIANESKKEPREEKDYRKIIHDLEDENKKPFEVTPIISPVFGVLNKNYKQEELAEKKAIITQTNSGAKSRLYGPVSYNDAPLPKPPVFEAKKNNLKEELVELNSTISDLISDNNEVDESEIELPAKIAIDDDLTETIDIPKIIDNEDTEDDDLIIETENYDEMPSSIETSSNAHTNIEDAFEPTSEFDSITDYDREVEHRSIEEEISEDEYEEDEPVEYEEDFVASHKIEEDDEDLEEVEIKEDKVVSKKSKPRKTKEVEEEISETEDENEKEYEKYEKESDDEHLTDTIETDLFNLIDSMYKDDEDEEDSEDE